MVISSRDNRHSLLEQVRSEGHHGGGALSDPGELGVCHYHGDAVRGL